MLNENLMLVRRATEQKGFNSLRIYIFAINSEAKFTTYRKICRLHLTTDKVFFTRTVLFTLQVACIPKMLETKNNNRQRQRETEMII